MDEDPRIDELIRSGRRRSAIGYAIFGVFLILAGAVTLIALLTQHVDLLENGAGGVELVVVSGGAIVIGLVLFAMAYKALRLKGAQPPDVALKKAEPLE